MRLLVLSCLLVFISEGLGLGYHQDVGVPEAARIRQREARQMSSRIIGGMPSQSGDNPYLAGLLITLSTGQMSVCSGTLVSNNKVLTAGRCWYDGYSQGRSIQVVLGSTQLFYGSRYSVSGISVHPRFDARKMINDIAMLTLRWGVSYDQYVQPALLPPPDVYPVFRGVSARVSGFGKTSEWSSVGPETAQSAISVSVVGTGWYECNDKLPPKLYYDSKLICTSGNNGWGACGGDLGGPLVIQNYYNTTSKNYTGSDMLIGVTTIMSPFGCQTSFATGYARVTSYLDWIQRSSVGPETAQSAISVSVVGTGWYECNDKLPPKLYYDSKLICTSGNNGWGACGGDLGGPLVIQNYYNTTSKNYTGSDMLIGVTTIMSPFGCQTSFATGYARVTSYLDWIQRNL
ncbi:hypothetical protein PYW08_012086 [Mythimna loreyi]|uniref:Uncharacterized protein n=1 Tax=Mythimna loreyi TaxID=667449 RepID=A0ACC2PZP4_9NEOP|nr:hypothetical protein PYW08_012086 [Mythimna loreyi]